VDRVLHDTVAQIPEALHSPIQRNSRFPADSPFQECAVTRTVLHDEFEMRHDYDRESDRGSGGHRKKLDNSEYPLPPNFVTEVLSLIKK
jgi:hypothetical protein